MNRIQDYFGYEVVLSDCDVCIDERIDWNIFCQNREKTKNEQYSIYVTEKAFLDNWFSHESYSYSILSTNDWEEVFSPPSLCAYIIYQIAQATVGFEIGLMEQAQTRMVHDEAIGCMFDFCAYKPEIKLGMVGGMICPRCRSMLKTYGIAEEALKAVEYMISYVRYEAIGKPIVFNEIEPIQNKIKKEREIFIGSSMEAVDYMETIAAYLEELQTSPLPWNADGKKIFIQGNNILDSLIDITNRVDAAIFIFNAEDAKWNDKSKLKDTKSVKDNVLFECGLFMGKLGRNKVCFICKGDYKRFFELEGIVYINGDVGEYQIRRKLREWINAIYEED